MLKLFAFSIAASALTAVPALAQDAPPPPPQDMPAPPTPMHPYADDTFRGIRVEGNFGWDQFKALGTDRDKFGYGATIGFDGQIGDRIVVGPEASFWRANDWTENCAAQSGGSACTKSFQEYGVGVRAGFLATPQLLVFGKGGYVGNEQRKRYTTTAVGRSYYDHYNTDGYEFGGGVEYSMANRFSGPLSGLYLSAQYVHSQYDDHTSRQRVMGGVGIHFK